MMKYFWSCGWLLLPILAWNAMFSRHLPGAWATASFHRDIPAGLALLENVSRFVVSALPFLMPLAPTVAVNRQGMFLYGFGLLLYWASWLAILMSPDSAWAMSAMGFLAPAYTPAIWLGGLAMIGQRLYWGTFYRWWMYLIPAGIFVVAHVAHAALVYSRQS